MVHPVFFEEIEVIKVIDPLSGLLGAFENGEYKFTYLDVVKSAGHSCPTVAGAYLVTLEALKALYPDERAVRGNIKVEFNEPLEDGVTGVISNVISQITGATDKSGFKGLNGKFARHSLMNFNSDVTSSVRFSRVDNSKSVDVEYDPNSVMPDKKQAELMQKMMQGTILKEELQVFGMLWQDRVKRIFEHKDNVIKITEIK